jgi:hypothetical protein
MMPAPSSPTGSDPGDGLLLAGGIVGIILGVLGVLLVPIQIMFLVFFSENAKALGFPQVAFPGGVVVVFLLFGLVLTTIGIAGGILALRGRTALRDSQGALGRNQAIAGAAMMLVGVSFVGGVLALIGALMYPRPTGAPNA